MTKKIKQSSCSLTEYCIKNNLLQEDTLLRLRKKCLNFLYNILNKIHTIKQAELVSTGIVPSSISKESIIKLYTFGSFRLGTNTSTSDIDALAVGPSYIDRNSFFKEFSTLLKKDSSYFIKELNLEDTEIPILTNLTVLEEAYVPIIKFVLDGIDFDLLYCQTSLPTITQNFNVLKDFDLIVNDLDEISIRSVNGVRTTEKILAIISELVSEEYVENIVNNFRIVLKLVKIWAKNRGIYSNVIGYIGGVSYSLLVSKSFQVYFENSEFSRSSKLNKNLNFPTASEILIHFFKTFSEWEWPKAVELIPYKNLQPSPYSWNPQKNYRNRPDKFPIITPTSPTINSSYNVFESTKTQMVKEFQRAYLLTKYEENGWDLIFSRTSIFAKYKVFLCIKFKETKEDSDLETNFGLVKIRCRMLFNNLERIVGLNIIPYSEDLIEEKEGNKKLTVLAALSIDKKRDDQRKSINISAAVSSFKELFEEELLEKVEVDILHEKGIFELIGEDGREEKERFKKEMAIKKKLMEEIKKSEIEDKNRENKDNKETLGMNGKEDEEIEEGEIVEEVGKKVSHGIDKEEVNKNIGVGIKNMKWNNNFVDISKQDFQDFTKF